MSFWTTEHGNAYTDRSIGQEYVANATALLARALKCAGSITSGLEIGCGTGNNLAALSMLFPGIALTGVEVNSRACEIANGLPCSPHIVHCAAMDCLHNDSYSLGYMQWDLTLSMGFLIHTPPEELQEMYRLLYRHTERYILLAEYYSPKPMEVEYHGHTGLLWKRDFAGEMLDRWSNLKLMDYGFIYHRDKWRQDDVTWFLLERR